MDQWFLWGQESYSWCCVSVSFWLVGVLVGQFFEGVEAQTFSGGQDDNISGFFFPSAHCRTVDDLFGRRARLDPEPVDASQHRLSVPMPILGVEFGVEAAGDGATMSTISAMKS